MGNVCQLHWCLPPGGSLEALLLELNGEDLVIRNLTKSNLPQVLKSVIVVFFFVVESCNSGTIQSHTGTHKRTVWLNNTVHRLNLKKDALNPAALHLRRKSTLKSRKAVIQQVLPCSSSAQNIRSSFISPRPLLGCPWLRIKNKTETIKNGDRSASSILEINATATEGLSWWMITAFIQL